MIKLNLWRSSFSTVVKIFIFRWCVILLAVLTLIMLYISVCKRVAPVAQGSRWRTRSLSVKLLMRLHCTSARNHFSPLMKVEAEIINRSRGQISTCCSGSKCRNWLCEIESTPFVTKKTTVPTQARKILNANQTDFKKSAIYFLLLKSQEVIEPRKHDWASILATTTESLVRKSPAKFTCSCNTYERTDCE